MNRRNALQQLGALALLASPVGLALGHPPAQAQGSFQVVKPEVPPMTPGVEGKIEILGFFHYGCSHCREFEPLIEQWAKRLPGDVVFEQVPVTWGRDLDGLARLHYTLRVMKRHDLHRAVFVAVQDQRIRLGDLKAAQKWAQSNKLDVSVFTNIYESVGINTQVMRAKKIGERYKIESVPTMTVAGRFLTSPALAGSSYEATLKAVDGLIERVRKG